MYIIPLLKYLYLLPAPCDSHPKLRPIIGLVGRLCTTHWQSESPCQGLLDGALVLGVHLGGPLSGDLGIAGLQGSLHGLLTETGSDLLGITLFSFPPHR